MTATLTTPAPTDELPGGSGVGGEQAPWWMPTMHSDEPDNETDEEQQRAA